MLRAQGFAAIVIRLLGRSQTTTLASNKTIAVSFDPARTFYEHHYYDLALKQQTIE